MNKFRPGIRSFFFFSSYFFLFSLFAPIVEGVFVEEGMSSLLSMNSGTSGYEYMECLLFVIWILNRLGRLMI